MENPYSDMKLCYVERWFNELDIQHSTGFSSLREQLNHMSKFNNRGFVRLYMAARLYYFLIEYGKSI